MSFNCSPVASDPCVQPRNDAGASQKRGQSDLDDDPDGDEQGGDESYADKVSTPSVSHNPCWLAEPRSGQRLRLDPNPEPRTDAAPEPNPFAHQVESFEDAYFEAASPASSPQSNWDAASGATDRTAVQSETDATEVEVEGDGGPHDQQLYALSLRQGAFFSIKRKR